MPHHCAAHVGKINPWSWVVGTQRCGHNICMGCAVFLALVKSCSAPSPTQSARVYAAPYNDSMTYGLPSWKCKHSGNKMTRHRTRISENSYLIFICIFVIMALIAIWTNTFPVGYGACVTWQAVPLTCSLGFRICLHNYRDTSCTRSITNATTQQNDVLCLHVLPGVLCSDSDLWTPSPVCFCHLPVATHHVVAEHLTRSLPPPCLTHIYPGIICDLS